MAAIIVCATIERWHEQVAAGVAPAYRFDHEDVCQDCGVKVAVSKSSVTVIEHEPNNHVIVCTPCGVKRSDEILKEQGFVPFAVSREALRAQHLHDRRN